MDLLMYLLKISISVPLNLLSTIVRRITNGDKPAHSVPDHVESFRLITVAPIDGNRLLQPFRVKVRSWTPISTIHSRILDELRAAGVVGQLFRSDLDILLLREALAVRQLEQEDLAGLRARAYRAVRDLPFDEVATFFDRLEDRQYVHVLIWLPRVDLRYPEDPLPAISWFITLTLKEMFSFEDATVASQNREETQTDFKTILKHAYDQLEVGDLFDMATGQLLPHSIVVASHIFQYRWRDHLSRLTSLKNINDAHNGLFLYKPVEWAFDRARICVEVSPEGKMTFRLLDQDLRNVYLADKACELREQTGRGNRRLAEEENLQTTFGDLDGQEVQFPEGVEMRPSKRLLGLHAVAAQFAAQERAPHDRIPNVAVNTSEDDTTERAIKNMTILEWRQSVL